jgi:hypothetical protein
MKLIEYQMQFLKHLKKESLWQEIWEERHLLLNTLKEWLNIYELINHYLCLSATWVAIWLRSAIPSLVIILDECFRASFLSFLTTFKVYYNIFYFKLLKTITNNFSWCWFMMISSYTESLFSTIYMLKCADA